MRKTLIASAAMLGVALAMPAFAQTATPEQDLNAARAAVKAHHPMRALQALNRAENEMIETNAAQEDRGARDLGEPPVIRQIGLARDAVKQHHWEQADHYITGAMEHPSTQ